MKIIEELGEISDPRRGQGQKFDMKHTVFFTLLALISGAKGYVDIHRFVETHFKVLKKRFKLKWKKSPCKNAIINILEKVDTEELEEILINMKKPKKGEFIAVDGKALKGSIDHAENGVVKQLLKVFSHKNKLVLAQTGIDKKTNEIPVFQELVGKLDLKGKIFTMDAMHCQKNSKIG